MPWHDVFWNDDVEAYMALHGLTYEDVENAICRPDGEDVSDSSGRPIRFGRAMDGRKIAVVFEVLDDNVTVYPITAYEVK